MAIDQKKWVVRVTYTSPIRDAESVFEFDSYDGAKRKFVFYVTACMEFPELSVRCINIFHGSLCVKYFQNYSVRVGNKYSRV